MNYRLAYTVDVTRGLTRTILSPALMTLDAGAHQVAVAVAQGTAPVMLSGATVRGYFVRADGTTVVLDGSAAGNVATVTLSSACYAVPGRCGLVIKAAVGDVVTSIFWGDGTVTRSSTNALATDHAPVVSLDALLHKIALLEQTTAAGQAAVASMTALHQTVTHQLQSGQLTGKGLTVSGYYATAAELNGIPSPLPGDAVGVGTAPPYRIYIYDGVSRTWKDNGTLQAPPTVELWRGSWASGSITLAQPAAHFRLLILGAGSSTAVMLPGSEGHCFMRNLWGNAGAWHVVENLYYIAMSGTQLTLAHSQKMLNGTHVSAADALTVVCGLK